MRVDESQGMVKNYPEFEYEIVTGVFLALALLARDYLAACAVILMYSVSQLAEDVPGSDICAV